MRRIGFLVALLLLASLGCKKEPASGEGLAAEQKGAPRSASKATAEEQQAAPIPDEEEPKSLPLDQVPEELKHQGYEYYGLSSLASVELEMKGEGKVFSGTRTTKLVKIADGIATFEVEHSGGLQGLGVSTYSVEKDGVYAVKISIGSFKPPHRMEIPAILKPGATWGGPITISMNDGNKVKTNLMYRVAGPEKVKTRAGVFDAILVTASGKGTVGSQKTKESMKLWFAKGVGPVKILMKRTVGKETSQSTIEATKVSK